MCLKYYNNLMVKGNSFMLNGAMAHLLNLQKGPCQLASSSVFLKLRHYFEDEVNNIDKLALERLQSSVTTIPDMSRYIIQAGGKRLRPLMTLICAKLLGYEHGNRHVHLATAVEFIHTATILHDDVVDNSHLRRGKKSANSVWSNKASILVGDFLLSQAFSLMVEDGSLEVLKILSHAAGLIAEGELRQLLLMHNLQTTEHDYFKVIESKTAYLFQAAAEVGAVIASPSPQKREICSNFGLYFGMAFQLIDDVLDYAASSEDLGKNIGDDFREGKVTLPVLLAYAQGNPQERAFLEKVFVNMEQEENDLSLTLDLLNRYHALEETKAKAIEYGEKAKACLNFINDHPLKNILIEMVDFCIHRNY
jgi:octaprenyl-diphosphate synthase